MAFSGLWRSSKSLVIATSKQQEDAATNSFLQSSSKQLERSLWRKKSSKRAQQMTLNYGSQAANNALIQIIAQTEQQITLWYTKLAARGLSKQHYTTQTQQQEDAANNALLHKPSSNRAQQATLYFKIQAAKGHRDPSRRSMVGFTSKGEELKKASVSFEFFLS